MHNFQHLLFSTRPANPGGITRMLSAFVLDPPMQQEISTIQIAQFAGMTQTIYWRRL